MPCQIKICGLSDEASIHVAIHAGANYIGLVHFAKSPRHVSLKQAAMLRKQLLPPIKSVLVVVNPDDALLENIIKNVKPDYIQLHGHETPARTAEIHTQYPTQKLIKAIPISTKEDLAQVKDYTPSIDMFLFDAMPPKNTNLPGGNGVAFDWKILQGFRCTKPWILSGGLTGDNVQHAIRQTGAKLVDVSSGVESTAGKKDPTKIKGFIARAGQN